MIKLRSYQEDAIEAIRECFTRESRQFVEMPTGSGKTITFLSYASQFHKKILIIVPSRQLLEQIKEVALLFYEPEEISQKGGGKSQFPKTLHICIINSIRGKYIDLLAEEGFDLTIIDEAHHSQSSSYQRIIKSLSYFDEDAKILGVTATPNRIDGQLISKILFNKSFCISIEELIDEGHLCNIEGYRVKTNVDISDIEHHNGDFNINQLYKKVCIDSRNNMIINICEKDMKGHKTIIFCVNIAHSKQISILLAKIGISSCHIDGTMKNEQRQSILNAFKDGEISVLCNCQLLTEGFDEPSINGIILARPTRSKSLFLQMIGRGLRTFPNKKNCKIIDIVDNHRALMGFNCILEDEIIEEIDTFKNIEDIRAHVSKEMIKITEFKIERSNFFNNRLIDEKHPTYSMTSYLKENNIKFYDPLSFDEANFLIWHNELKRKFYGNNN